MQAQKDGAACRAIHADMLENDEHRAQQSFVAQKDRCSGSRVTKVVASGGVTPGPNEKRGHQNERQTAGCPVCEFNQRLRLRGHRKELAVAKRPMAATSCAGSGSAHVRAPEDGGDVVGKGEPSKARKRGSSGFGNTTQRVRARGTATGRFGCCTRRGLLDASH